MALPAKLQQGYAPIACFDVYRICVNFVQSSHNYHTKLVQGMYHFCVTIILYAESFRHIVYNVSDRIQSILGEGQYVTLTFTSRYSRLKINSFVTVYEPRFSACVHLVGPDNSIG